jgi:hypothetical protein
MWVEDQQLNENIRITSSGKLTIRNSDITFSENSKLMIAEGGSLILDNALLISENLPSELITYGYCDEYNRSTIIVDGGLYEGAFQLEIKASEGTLFNGASANINGELFIMNDTTFSHSFEEGVGIIEVGLQGHGCTTPISINSITISHDDVMYEYKANELEYRNMIVKGDRSYEIDILGNFSSYNSTIKGAVITSSGEINLIDTEIDMSGPIILNDNNASIVLGGETNFKGSLDDHDIRAMPESIIEWGENVSGTGGPTDKWERRINEGQYLEFDAIGVIYQITGLYGANTIVTGWSDDNGISYIDGGRERIVEVGWSDDNIWVTSEIWKENAVINIIEYETAWNPKGLGMDNYGSVGIKLGYANMYKIEGNTPQINWISLEAVENLENASGSIDMVARIGNNGTAPAQLAITCYLNTTGEVAQTDTYPNTLVEPGEISEIIFNWQKIDPGEERLDCIILTPLQLVKDDAFGGGNITSTAINWEINDIERVSSSYLLPLTIALFLGLISAFYAIMNIRNKHSEEDE